MKIHTSKLVLLNLIITTILLSACERKKEEVVSPPLSIAEKIDEYELVMRHFKFDEKQRVEYKQHYPFHGKCYADTDIDINEDKYFKCKIIDKIISNEEYGKKYLYVAVHSIYVDESSSYFNLYKFELLNSRNLKQVSKNDEEILCGRHSFYCGYETFKYGNGPELGWILDYWKYSSDGYGGGNNYFIDIDKEFKSILSLSTSFTGIEFYDPDDPDDPRRPDANDKSAKEIESIETKNSSTNAKINQVIDKNKKVYDIHVIETTENVYQNKINTSIDEYFYTFNETSNKYILRK